MGCFAQRGLRPFGTGTNLPLLAAVLLLLGRVSAGEEQDGVTVSVKQGLLQADVRYIKETNDEKMVVCSGIPYAEPPVGDQRFKDSVPAAPWEGERGCSSEGNECTQPLNPAGGTLSKGAEDCLYLNVYAPHPLPEGAAVMVWIHGGAFISGDGGSMIYGPDQLVAQRVVVVTLNYRMGALGFLNMGTEEAPGNQGLKDQVLALRWVKENIAAFGGDPNNVTIFGESAGSASVHYHTISPMSEGLFQRAIMQSGSVLNNWAFKNDTRGNVEQLLKVAKCELTDPAAAIACLRKAPARPLVVPAVKFKSREDLEENALIAFTPTVDGRFLPEEPCAMVAKRAGASTPTLAGYNSGEGIINIGLVRMRGGTGADDEILRQGRGLCLSCEPCPAAREELQQWGARVRQRYLDGQPLAEDNLQGFVDYSTFIMFFRGIIRAIRARASLPPPHHYFYQFDVQGSLNFAKVLFGGGRMNGSAHADELAYLFNNQLLSDITFDNDSVEALTRRRLVKLWTNFAKTGNPTPETSDLLPVKWEPFTVENEQYYHIGNDGVEMRQHPSKADTEFFENMWKDV